MKKQSNKKGFTIIEVVLVLAIAGLIFLMVFVALPALQRSQRDTQRRNDMARVDTSLTQYQTNNQNTNGGTNLPVEGDVPVGTSKFKVNDSVGCYDKDNASLKGSSDSACSFLQRYMNSGDGSMTENEFQDPDGTYYGIDIKQGAFSYTGNEMDHMIYIRTSARCQGEQAIAGNARDYAVLYRLEGSGVYCIDNL